MNFKINQLCEQKVPITKTNIKHVYYEIVNGQGSGCIIRTQVHVCDGWSIHRSTFDFLASEPRRKRKLEETANPANRYSEHSAKRILSWQLSHIFVTNFVHFVSFWMVHSPSYTELNSYRVRSLLRSGDEAWFWELACSKEDHPIIVWFLFLHLL